MFGTTQDDEPESDRERLKQKIEYLDGAHEPAAPEKKILQYLQRELGYTESGAESFVGRLERDGEIYPVRGDYYRVTSDV